MHVSRHVLGSVVALALCACNNDGAEPVANQRFCRGQRATPMSGEINKLTWTRSESPYVLTGDIRVLDSLRVEAGTVVCADAGVGIRVDGALVAIGTAAAPILFTASATPAPWRGIVSGGTSPSSDTSRFRHVRIEYATTGVALRGPFVMDSSRVRQIRGTGVALYHQATRVEHTMIDSAAIETGPAVQLEAGMFERNTIAGSTRTGLVLAGPDMTVREVVVRGGAHFGVLISGDRVVLTRCAVHDNAEGIRVEAEAVRINDCNIVDNVRWGVVHDDIGFLNAENNYWGDATGPTGPASDGLLGTIDYSPFRTVPVALDTTSFRPH